MKHKCNLKQFKLTLVAIGISMAFFSSCSKQPENLSVIPKDTDVVFVVDMASIAKKGNLKEIENLRSFKTLKKELKDENKKLSNFFDDIVEEPKMTGIDFKTDFFGYYIQDGGNYFCLSMKLKNAENFESFLNNFLKKADMDFKKDEDKGINYILVEREVIFAWDKNKAVLVVAGDYKSRENLEIQAEELMKLNKNDQIAANANFNKFYKKKKDVSLWISMNILDKMPSYSYALESMDYDLSDSYIAFFLNFEKKKISLLTEYFPNKEMEEYMKKHKAIWDVKFNNNLLKYFPEQTYGLMSGALNSKEYYKMMEENADMNELISMLEKELNVDMNELLSNLKGSFLYSLTSIEKMEYTYLGWGYVFHEEKAKKIDEKYPISILGDISEEDIAALNRGETVKTQQGGYNSSYGGNISDLLADGITIEKIIEEDMPITFYQGGWEYEKNVEIIKEKLFPLMGMAFDIENKNIFINLMKENISSGLIKHDNYFEIKTDGISAYILFNDNICMITNDKQIVDAFPNGGLSENLSKNKIKSNISKNFYLFANLDYSEYSSAVKEELEDIDPKFNTTIKNWDQFGKSLEIKQTNQNSMEFIFNIKNDKSNSLEALIIFADNLYKSLSN